MNDSVGCTTDTCDEANDVVVHQPVDSICSDANVCTGAEHCDAALGCVNGTGLSLDDNNPCTIDSCDPLIGVGHQSRPEGSSCGAGLVCDAASRCRQGVAFAGFSNLTSIQLNGSAVSLNATPVLSGGATVLRLTNNLNQGSSALLKSPLALASNGTPLSWSAHATFQMTNGIGISDDDGIGADGLTFILAKSSTAVGALGASVGYAGVTPSVVVEFDTFNNGGGDNNNGNHIGINLNGNTTSIALTPVSTRFNNGQVWYVWIDYNGPAHLLDVRAATSDTRPTAPTLSASVDIRAQLGTDSAFFGFTSGTGAASNHHDLRSLVLTSF